MNLPSSPQPSDCRCSRCRCALRSGVRKGGSYDVVTASRWDPNRRCHECRVALIVYLSKHSNSTWKLLRKTDQHGSLISAMWNLLGFLDFQLYDVLGKYCAPLLRRLLTEFQKTCTKGTYAHPRGTEGKGKSKHLSFKAATQRATEHKSGAIRDEMSDS
ncbi:hypothetical protein K491DRAFT_295714 [Lophiostoma macrostomum CBS 122681]|uniref:Uncharacterized protein n=1 Tax=Lophiostoma macrostomum CBS 122681 TaxID=1314788 RepID=A0A6A6TFR6_9PLEO|nr:hypothetical protein K491DRAFT_295714 [Lophiostoma macrostomum CBS 122681]